MEPVFTLAGPSHAGLVIEMMEELYAVEHLRFDEAPARRALERLLGDRSLGRVYLIGPQGEAAGYVVLTFGFSLEFHGRDALVDELYVRQGHRSRGLGQASLRFLEEVCRGEGIAALHLEVDRVNTRAQALYRRAGYRDHDRHLLTKWLEATE